MVYMHFPAHLTEEEEMLTKKYAKLRKKKRILQNLRSQQKQEPKQEPETPIKSSEEAAHATAQAKKLLKSGAIKLSTEKKEHQGFKRSKRLKEGGDKPAVVFQPFTGPDGMDERPEDAPRPVSPTSPHPTKRKKLHESFVSARESKDTDEGGSSEGGSEDRGDSDREHRRERPRDDFRRDQRRDRPFRERPFQGRGGPDRDGPQKGNTIHIRGHGITEDLLRQTFSNFGNILNISMEQEKKYAIFKPSNLSPEEALYGQRISCGFLTFEKMESAEEAINQMNGTVVGEAQLRVSMARRQPTFEVNSAPTPEGDDATWSAIAANKGQMSHRDSRHLVAYEEDIF